MNHHHQEMAVSATADTVNHASSSPATTSVNASNRRTMTTAAEALVVEALASMVQQQPLTPPPSTGGTNHSSTTPSLMDYSPTQSFPPRPPLTLSSSPALPIATAATQKKMPSTVTAVPLPQDTATTVQTPHQQEQQQQQEEQKQVQQNAPTNSDHKTTSPPTCLPVTTTTQETTASTTAVSPQPTTTATTTATKKRRSIMTNQPRLPARERQPPKRKSRAHRRKLLTAPLPRPCLTHTPTLRELQSITFSDYVQKIVLASAVLYEQDSDEDEEDDDHSDISTDSEDEEEDWKTKPMPLAEGIAKVTLPKGFWPTEEVSWTQGDRTGRGPAWQSGTPLGDYRIEAPIAQHVRGLAGVYEFSFVDKGSTTLAEFRQKADTYREQVVGCAYDVFEEKEETKQEGENGEAGNSEAARNRQEPEKKEESAKVQESLPDIRKPKHVFKDEEERLAYLERFFWKRLGPTMPPAWYGADHEGTLFPEDDDATGWSLGQLDSCLHVLPKVPGVTSPYLYAGMWASVFCAHSEDMNLLSINYLHAGAPKIWYAIAPGTDAQRFESLCASSFAGTPSTAGCKEFLRHKRSLLSPKVLLKAGIKYTTAIQRPGDAIITFPAGYHFGFNAGFNVAEATNFAVPEWIPYAWQARVCLCRPDSVRIDMNRLTSLLGEFDQDQSRWRRKRLSWKEWSAQKHAKRLEAQQQPILQQKSKGLPDGKKKTNQKAALSEQQRKGEFWIEVVKPLARRAKQPTKAPSPKKEKKLPPEEAGRGKRKRKLTAKAAKWERELLRKKVVENNEPKKPSVVVEEIWHLAKPLPRKIVAIGLKVLCLLPGTTMGYAPKNSWRVGAVHEPQGRKTAMDLDNDDGKEDEGTASGRGRQRKHVTDDEEEQDEQCFKGQIVELSDDHARIHIDGLPRSEDVWMNLNDSKVFLDGGRWDDEEAAEDDGTGRSLPQLHYWEEMDSKRRCV